MAALKPALAAPRTNQWQATFRRSQRFQALITRGPPLVAVNDDEQRVSVMAPDVIEPEIREILGRHQPKDLSVR